MDLDRCPRCGQRWPGGDKCNRCGFVPIGVGLDKLPKKKKRRFRRYVEPGSSRGFLLTLFIGVAGWGMYRYQPWQNDWELIRDLYGQGRHHSVVGQWEITKTMVLGQDKPPVVADKGLVTFKGNGEVIFDLNQGGNPSKATGHYEVHGENISVTRTTTLSGESKLPSSMGLLVGWTGADSAILGCNASEILYVRRHSKGNALARLLQMALKNGGKDSGQLRGMIATIKKSAQAGD